MPSVLHPPFLSLSLPERQTKEMVLFLPHHHHHHHLLLLLLLLLPLLLLFLLDVSSSLTRARFWRPPPLTICSRRMVWRHQNKFNKVKRGRTRREPTEVTRKCPRCIGMTFLHPPPSTKSPKCMSAIVPPIEKCSHHLPSRFGLIRSWQHWSGSGRIRRRSRGSS
jgi:hypothetical protein